MLEFLTLTLHTQHCAPRLCNPVWPPQLNMSCCFKHTPSCRVSCPANERLSTATSKQVTSAEGAHVCIGRRWRVAGRRRRRLPPQPPLLVGLALLILHMAKPP